MAVLEIYWRYTGRSLGQRAFRIAICYDTGTVLGQHHWGPRAAGKLIYLLPLIGPLWFGLRDAFNARSKDAEYRTAIDKKHHTVAAVDWSRLLKLEPNYVEERLDIYFKYYRLCQMSGRVSMTDEHLIHAQPLECRLVSCMMEIDDDDEDVIQVSIDVANEAAMPIGGLDIFIQTSDNRKVESMEGISSLGPGLTRRFTFEFPLQTGDWTFMLRSPSVKADLGPYEAEFTFQAEKGRVYNNAIGSGMFTDAFTADLGDFGNTEERGVIDSSSIKMTSYFGENSAGGSTAIGVGNAPVEDTASEDEPRIPPWQKHPTHYSRLRSQTIRNRLLKPPLSLLQIY